jgi:mannose-6-phosphate isomerase-like protein (cupin superfamily)
MTAPAIRRVVTTHDANGRAIIALDEVVRGEFVTQGWSTDEPLSNNVDGFEAGSGQPGPTVPGGAAIRFLDIDPGYQSPMHRTNSIDYVMILDGELEMTLDGGETVTIKAGDIVIQRGTNHAWQNKSGRVCRMVSTLIAAEPVTINGRPLDETWDPTSMKE